MLAGSPLDIDSSPRHRDVSTRVQNYSDSSLSRANIDGTKDPSEGNENKSSQDIEVPARYPPTTPHNTSEQNHG